MASWNAHTAATHTPFRTEIRMSIKCRSRGDVNPGVGLFLSKNAAAAARNPWNADRTDAEVPVDDTYPVPEPTRDRDAEREELRQRQRTYYETYSMAPTTSFTDNSGWAPPYPWQHGDAGAGQYHCAAQPRWNSGGYVKHEHRGGYPATRDAHCGGDGYDPSRHTGPSGRTAS